MPIAIDEEVIFPRLPLAGARFDLGEIDAIPPERRERMMQRANLVADADHQTRAVITRGRTALATEHEETRRIGGIVLNVLLENFHAIFLRRQQTADGRRTFFLGGQFR